MAERTNPITFLQQVRAEVSKVVWPSRREIAITTLMVVIFAVVASIFFLVIDQLLGWLRELHVQVRPGRALDFGCGVGRLTQALAGKFSECDGVDIAP